MLLTGFFICTSLVVISLVILAVIWIAARDDMDDALIDDDFPVQNDFGVSIDRFGYIQDARNGGDA